MTSSKEKLRELANEIKALLELERGLLKQQFLLPAVSFELGDWFVAAVENYLSGTKGDLSKALGLKRGPGRPKPPPSGKKGYERSKKIFLMRQSGKSWSKVAAEFPKPGLRELQRELKRYQLDIIAENTRELIAKLKHRRRPSGNK
jgi:hypothetical protein